MRFHRQEDFAIIFMSELGKIYPQRLSLSLVAEKHGISNLYLKKIVRELRQANLVESKEGTGGGYTLAKNPKSISLWDVTNAVSGQGQPATKNKSLAVECPLFSGCLPQRIKKLIGFKLEESLSSVSLAQIVNG